MDTSNIYNNNKDGRAIWIRITAGIMVQTLSTICIYSKFLLIKEFLIIEIIINPTNLIINFKTRLIKSWEIPTLRRSLALSFGLEQFPPPLPGFRFSCI
jgi:hypothetical protein